MLIFVLIITLINLVYWLFLYSKVSFYNEENLEKDYSDRKNIKILIVIAVHNEAQHLKENLELILNQDLMNYEVLLIDDASTDGTLDTASEYEKKYKKLKIRKFNTPVGKKMALHTSLREEEVDILLFTDGDCRPASGLWLSHMISKIGSGKEIVLGFGPFFKRRSLLNKFARYESVITALQYFSFALAGFPYMGVGRNLAYNKKLFDLSNGFTSHLDIRSGDDDLFISDVANKNNTNIQLLPGSFVYSYAKTNWKDYFNQKRRHISTSTHYRFFHKVLLMLYAMSQVCFFIGLFLVSFKWALLLYISRMIIIYASSFKAFYKLKEQDLLLFLPLLDLMVFPYYFILALLSILPNRKTW